MAPAASAAIFCPVSGTCNGTSGNNTIVGTPGIDDIYAHEGNDLIHARAGVDLVFGGQGNDDIYLGQGNDDEGQGGEGSDLVIAGCHPSAYTCTPGTTGSGTILRGNNAGDTLGADNGIGVEYLYGGEGDDTCFLDFYDWYTNCQKVIEDGVCISGCASLTSAQWRKLQRQARRVNVRITAVVG